MDDASFPSQKFKGVEPRPLLRHVQAMGERDRAIEEIAEEQHFLVSRPDVMSVGGSDDLIRWRVKEGRWVKAQAAVYQVDLRPSTWRSQLMAAVLAAGEGSLASHRAALVLWGMDGLGSAPVELTVPYTHGPVPKGTIVHRTRRPMDAATLDGIPVTAPERTLLDCSATLPPLVVAKAVDSALRMGLTTMERLNAILVKKGGKGVRGTRKLRWVLAERVGDAATGSPAEVGLLFHLQREGVPEPVTQYEIRTPDGQRMVLDLYWPVFRKAVEVDGVDAHSSADSLDHDLRRQNALMDLGIELRRFSARQVRREPETVVDHIRRFLGC